MKPYMKNKIHVNCIQSTVLQIKTRLTKYEQKVVVSALKQITKGSQTDPQEFIQQSILQNVYSNHPYRMKTIPRKPNASVL